MPPPTILFAPEPGAFEAELALTAVSSRPHSLELSSDAWGGKPLSASGWVTGPLWLKSGADHQAITGAPNPVQSSMAASAAANRTPYELELTQSLGAVDPTDAYRLTLLIDVAQPF